MDAIQSTDSPVEIQLPEGYVAVVDEIDRDLASLKWTARKLSPKHRIPYVNRHVYRNGTNCTDLLHRVIMARMVGRALERSEHIDHVDNNPLNNQRSNLRLATDSQNGANKPMRRDNSSGYKGVRLKKGRTKWMARITVNRQEIFLGYYCTPEEAHNAYVEAANKYFGEFANAG